MRHRIAVLGVVVLVALAGCGGGTATPTASPTATRAMPTPTLALAATPTVTVAPTISTLPPRLMVANTGGQGVMLRKTPGGDAIRAWADGSVMQTAGADQVAAGRTWRNVKDPAGNVGWIAADFLIVAPASSGTAAPAATATPRS